MGLHMKKKCDLELGLDPTCKKLDVEIVHAVYWYKRNNDEFTFKRIESLFYELLSSANIYDVNMLNDIMEQIKTRKRHKQIFYTKQWVADIFTNIIDKYGYRIKDIV
jgi:hypothetical protein